jgi:hypothetical protein
MKLINPTPDNFNKNYIYFNDPIQNTIINESRFIRIIYSTPNIIFNGINILVNFIIDSVDKQYNKNIINYSVEKNEQVIKSINNIEKTILDKYCSNKVPSYNLASQISSGSLKLFSESIDKKKNIDVILKISGLWEDDSSYGITYKFLLTD